MVNRRKIYIKKLELELKKWGVDIEKFKKKAAITKSSATITVRKKIEVLGSKQNKVQEKIKKLHICSDSAWADLKVGAEKALAELRTSVRKAVAEFK
jgi:hypothetical protein